MHTHEVTQISGKHLTRNIYSAHIPTTRNTWGHRSQTSHRGRLSRKQHYKHTVFTPEIFSCIWRLRVCPFAGPIGWNRGYPFNPGDLSVCITVAGNYLEGSSKVPWDDLRYIFGEIMYGG